MGWKALRRKYFDCKRNKKIFFPDFKKIITFPLACGGRHLHSFENQRLYHINCWWCLWRSLFISTFLSLFLTAIIIIKFKYYCCGLCYTFLLCSGIAETMISLWTLLIKGGTFMTENYQKSVIVVGSLRAKWKRRHLLWCLLGQWVLLWQNPEVFARSDVNNIIVAFLEGWKLLSKRKCSAEIYLERNAFQSGAASLGTRPRNRNTLEKCSWHLWSTAKNQKHPEIPPKRPKTRNYNSNLSSEKKWNQCGKREWI